MQPLQPPAGAARDHYRVWRTITTRWLDNDVYGHINNVVYYAYIDTAVNGWLIERCGTDIRNLAALGIVAESSCRFLQPLSFPQTVSVGLRLEKLGRSSVVYQLGLFGAEQASAAALGRFVHVYVDSHTRRPVSVPQIIRTALLDIEPV